MLKTAFLAIGFAVLSAAPAAAQTVYAILVGDTEDTDIGEGARVNMNKMRAFLKSVSTEGKISVTVSEVKEDAFSCTAILSALRAVKATPDDAVFFYYAGHGFRRSDSQTKFPEFDCRRSNSVDRADLSGVSHYFSKSGPRGPSGAPRLVLAIADSCNMLIDEREAPRQAAPRPYSLPNREPAFKQLFLHYSGTLTMSGSLPGAESWYLHTGGLFTIQLLSALDTHSLSLAQAHWESIADDAITMIDVPLPTPTTQQPQFELTNFHLQTAAQ